MLGDEKQLQGRTEVGETRMAFGLRGYFFGKPRILLQTSHNLYGNSATSIFDLRDYIVQLFHDGRRVGFHADVLKYFHEESLGHILLRVRTLILVLATPVPR